MSEGFKKGLLKLLKGHKDLQESALKVSRDNLNDFKSNLNSSEGSLENLENVSERKIKSKDFNEDFNENQLKAE